MGEHLGKQARRTEGAQVEGVLTRISYIRGRQRGRPAISWSGSREPTPSGLSLSSLALLMLRHVRAINHSRELPAIHGCAPSGHREHRDRGRPPQVLLRSGSGS